MSWSPLDPPPGASLPADENLAAVVAALRPVRAAFEAVADAMLAAPGWQPGGGAEHAAFIEGQKTVWRLLRRLMDAEDRT